MKSGPHRVPCRIEVTVSEIIVATRTPWFHRSAFKAWVKNSFSTLAGVPIIDVTGLVGWKDALIVAGVLIAKDLLTSMYEILYGKDAESYRESPGPVSSPDPRA